MTKMEAAKFISTAILNGSYLSRYQMVESAAVMAVNEMQEVLTDYVPSDDAAALKVTVTVEEVALDGEGE